MNAALLTLLAVVALLLLYASSAKAESPAEAKKAAAVTFVFIKIPEQIMPLDRGEKYEDPLGLALETAGLGEVTGGGSQLGAPGNDGARQVEWVGIDVDLKNLARGIPFLKAELKRLGAPAGTTIEYESDGKQVVETL